MTTRSITILPTVQSSTVGVDAGYRFTIQVTSAVGVSTKIFRYLRRPAAPDETDTIDVFDGVCSPADLEEFPEDEPSDNRLPAFLRLDYVDLLFRSVSQADEALRLIKQEIETLIDVLKLMDTQTELAEITYGDVVEDSSSVGA